MSEGCRTLFGTRIRTRISFSRIALQVDAQGHQPQKVRLEDYYGKTRDLPEGALPPITVELQPIQ